MTKLMIAALAVVLTTQAQALTQEEHDYFTIDTVTVQEIPDESPLLGSTKTFEYTQDLPISPQISQIKQLEVEVDTIINIGEKIWAIVEAGKPVVNVQLNSASAMPAGIKDWQQLVGWKTPRSLTYRVHYTNLFTMNVVDFSYRVMFTYGGNYNGQGHYVTGATIVPAILDVAWGYSFKATVEIPTVINMGTAQNPVGGIQMNVSWEVGTVIKNSQTRASYFVDGLGQLKQLD
ncbi:MAG: hypothetical protein H7235_05750 [Bdellovibrionaceae bacterium]|nr:hypothetical protein [Pseudobdellovibrionaceae bacterium]